MCVSERQVMDRMLRGLRAAGHRVLIFSQFVRVLEVLEDYFHMRTDVFGEDCVRVYHGGMSHEEKEVSIAEFQVCAWLCAWLCACFNARACSCF